MNRLGTTTACSSNFDGNRMMHDVGIRCVDMTLGLLRFQLHSTCSGTLFLSFEVRACCDSAVDFTGRKVVSVVVIFKIEVACDFYVPKQRISTSWGVCRLLGCSRKAPSAALQLLAHELHRRAESNFRFVPVAQTQCPSTSGRPFQKSLSSPIMPCSICSRAFFNLRNRAFPMSDCM